MRSPASSVTAFNSAPASFAPNVSPSHRRGASWGGWLLPCDGNERVHVGRVRYEHESGPCGCLPIREFDFQLVALALLETRTDFLRISEPNRNTVGVSSET
jgi:hypothetical protein